MNTVCIIQARLGSTRLPGKVLADICGETMLAHVIERARAIKGVDVVAVATTTDPEDAAVADAARSEGAPVFRGHPSDVLDRYYLAALAFEADAIVRITADCPLLDPAVSSLVVQRFLRDRPDYCSNILPPTYPDGLDTEVLSFGALKRVWRTATLASDREHVTTYIRTHTQDRRVARPNTFRVLNMENSTDLSALRWTVDEPDDLAFVRGVLVRTGPRRGVFPSMNDVLRLVSDHPELAALNASHRRNEGWARSIEQDRAAAA